MLNTYKIMILKSLFNSQGIGKVINLINYYFNYPNSPYVLTGGINIIHRCNLNCSFCIYRFGNRKEQINDIDEVSFDKCLEIEAFKYAFIISIGSGEPFLHKDLFKFIDKVHNKKKLVSLATNGILLKKRMKELIKSPPDLLWLSHYDNIEDVQLKSIKTLMKNKPKSLNFGISKIISKNNLKDMIKILKIANDFKVKNVFFQQMVPPADLKKDKSLINKIICDTEKKSLDYIEKIKKIKRDKFKDIDCTFPNPINTLSKKSFCYFLYKGFSLEPNGAIQPCCIIHPMGKDIYGNLFKDNLAHIHNKKFMALKKSFINKNVKKHNACKYCYGVNFK